MTNMRKLWVNVEVMVHETKSYNFEKEISRIAFEKKKRFGHAGTGQLANRESPWRHVLILWQ